MQNTVFAGRFLCRYAPGYRLSTRISVLPEINFGVAWSGVVVVYLVTRSCAEHMKIVLSVPGVCVLLAAVTFAVYYPVRWHDFVNYDDPDYVTENVRVLSGVTAEGIIWAFTRPVGDHTYWHPLSWLSHMVDCELFGLRAGAHHLVNVAFHIVNAILVFLVLRRLTCSLGRSAVVGALFALHPLQVDTVAWVTERKNVLSTLFLLLTVWAYARYVEAAVHREAGLDRQPKLDSGNSALDDAPPDQESAQVPLFQPRSPKSKRLVWYAAALVLFALGLMSKPSVVTLPCVLLLLDFWPLHRLSRSNWLRLVLEKLPFFVLSAASSAVTLLAHQKLGVLSSSAAIPFGLRTANALVSYASYLRRVFWPNDLVVFYPFPSAVDPVEAFAAAAILLGISGLAIWLRKTHSHLFVGWFWFLGTLVPTIGLVQAGAQAMADRFTYVPLIGLFLMLVWEVESFLRNLAFGKVIKVGAVVLALGLCFGATARQLNHWKNSVTLFERAAAVTTDNAIAHNNLGTALLSQGKADRAIEHFRMALAINPHFAIAYYNLGNALDKIGRRQEALENYRVALRYNPRDEAVYFNIANSMADNGLLAEAVAKYEEALRIRPDYASAHNNLAIALVRLGKLDQALKHALEALKLDPANPEVHNNLGRIYAEKGDDQQAVIHYRGALRSGPGLARAHYNLGNSLMRLGRINEAQASFQKSVEIDPGYWEPRSRLGEIWARLDDVQKSLSCYSNVIQLNPEHFVAWHNLGAGLAEIGRLNEATNFFQRALTIKPDYLDAHISLASAFSRLAEPAKAEFHLREALRVDPASPKAHYELARILYRQSNLKQCLDHLLEAVRLQPDWPQALNDAAWILATAPDARLRNGPEALRLADRANRLSHSTIANMVGTKAAAYAECGRFAEAIESAEKAIELASKSGLVGLAEETRTRLALYRSGKPFHAAH